MSVKWVASDISIELKIEYLLNHNFPRVRKKIILYCDIQLTIYYIIFLNCGYNNILIPITNENNNNSYYYTIACFGLLRLCERPNILL